MPDFTHIMLGFLVAPGIALLVLSSAFRFQQLENQIQLVSQGKIGCNKNYLKIMKGRVLRFRRAFIALYSALALIALGAALAVFDIWLQADLTVIIVSLIFIAVLAVLFAILQLLLEALRSADVIFEQIEGAERHRPTRQKSNEKEISDGASHAGS